MASLSYYRFKDSFTWRRIRFKILQERGRHCEQCGAGDYLEVHHKTYERFGGREWPEDLEILCTDCHALHHARPLPQRRNVRPLKVLLEPYFDELEKAAQRLKAAT